MYESKPNPLKTINSSFRIAKVERDAKEICIGAKSKKQDHQSFCKICKESGSLMYCSHCPVAYHLNCARMKEGDIPNGNWYCTKCIPVIEKKIKEETLKIEKSERNIRTGKIKEALSGLTNLGKDKIIEKFGKKYPQFVKQGKITYPIEDLLLQLDPGFHQVTLIDLPLPSPCKYPQDSFLDILSITNLYTHFLHT